MLTGTNLTYTKTYNYRIVFETIRLYGPISRADIARFTALTAQTVSNITKRLLDNQLIREGQKKQEGRGAPSLTLEINPEGSYSIGLDFNRDHITGVLVDLSGNMKGRQYVELDTIPGPDEAIKLMARTIEDLLRSQNLTQNELDGVGIGFPGPIELKGSGTVTNTVNPKSFPEWEHVPVVKMLSNYVDVPIYLGNNASVAAVGENWYGAGQHISNFLYVFFGAGLGSGLIINGQYFEGHSSNAGEIGYFPFMAGSSPLISSDQPHIGEHFNLSRLYQWLNSKGVEINRPADLETLYYEENPHLREWLDQAIEILTPAFLTVEYLIDPQVIFLGGRLPFVLFTDICQNVTNKMPKSRIKGKESGPELRCGTAGIDAAALGAATLPMFELFAPEHQLLIKRNKKEALS